MPRFRPLFPERVTIERLDRARTVEDSLGGEPRRRIVRKPTFVVLAEVDDLSANRRRADQGGATIEARAEVRIPRSELRRTSYAPLAGDRVVSIANRKGEDARVVSWVVEEVHASTKERAGSKTVVLSCSTSPADRQVEGPT